MVRLFHLFTLSIVHMSALEDIKLLVNEHHCTLYLVTLYISDLWRSDGVTCDKGKTRVHTECIISNICNVFRNSNGREPTYSRT